jgi:hypothetical protein
MRCKTIGLALVTVLAAWPAAASARERLVSDLVLTSHTPGTPTGATLHLVWPDGPDGKPKPEAEGVFALPAGTVVDESAIPTCTASDVEMQALGEAACPEGSRLGPGVTTLISGLGAPFDPFVLDDYWFHGPGQIVALYWLHGTRAPTLKVNRVEIRGSTFIARPSYPPGYPPGTNTTAKQSDQVVDAKVTEAGSFITTPPRCPRSRKWISHATVTYDDGSVDTATAVTRCKRRRR